MAWRVEFLDEGVLAALRALPIDIRASFERIVGRMRQTASNSCARPT
jgi:hypothetical protein